MQWLTGVGRRAPNLTGMGGKTLYVYITIFNIFFEGTVDVMYIHVSAVVFVKAYVYIFIYFFVEGIGGVQVEEEQ